MTDQSAPILILPGINGSGEGHWQTAWERSLPQARRVQVRDWDRPSCADWVAALERCVVEEQARVAMAAMAAGANPAEAPAASKAGPVLVAHSLGCLQVVHWAARTGRRSIRGALLVAPPDPDAQGFPREASGFDGLPKNKLPFPSIVVASGNDPYASLDFSRRMAALWGSRFVDVGCRGHLNVASGIGPWDEGRIHLDELCV